MLSGLSALAATAVLTAVVLGQHLSNQSVAGSGSETAGLAKNDRASRDALLGVRAKEARSLPPGSKPGTPPTVTPVPTSAPTSTPTATPTSLPFVWPADGWISQRMSAVHPNGIDIAVGTGEPVRSVRAGRVAFAGGGPSFPLGNFIVVQHDEGWSSLYAHLSAFAVKKDDLVVQGQRLGSAGATGYASGPHVHFELRQHGAPVNPLSYLPARANLYIAPDEVAPAPLPPPPPPAPPTSEPPPPAPDTTLPAGQAIAMAAAWMTNQGGLVYTVNPSSCSAVRSGPNWRVSCVGEPVGCVGTACATTLSACVFEQPVLVTNVCP